MKRPVTFAMFFLALATAACVQPAPTAGPVPSTADAAQVAGQVAPPVIATTPNGGVLKFCDARRAVYVFDGYKSGGIAVVENAPECAQ